MSYYKIYSPDSSFNGVYSGYKFDKGVCIAKLDENLKTWFKMLGFKVEKTEEPKIEVKKETKNVSNEEKIEEK